MPIETCAVRRGERGAFDLQMDEVGSHRIKAIKLKAFQQRKLLQHDWPLTPDASLAHGVAAIVVRERRLDMRLPCRHISGGEKSSVTLPADVQHLLRAAEPVDRFGDE